MALSTKEAAELKKIIQIAQTLIKKAGQGERVKPSARSASATGSRRSGTELVAFREKLMSEREAGVPVARIAKKYGVSPSYIYQMG